MNPRLFLSILISFLFLTSQAQNWSPVGTGFHHETEGKEASIFAMAVYKGELYAGGIFTSAGDKKALNIAKWNGKEWSAVGGGIDGKVTALCVYKDELYAGGIFGKAGETNTSNIARWNGERWADVAGGTDSDIQALAIYKEELVAGGDFTNAGSVTAKHVARWNGAVWAACGHGVNNDIYSLAEAEGELHAGGSFEVKAGEVVHNLFKWNGKRWAGEGDFDGTVAALSSYNGKLVVAGPFGKANDEPISFVSVYSDKMWQMFGTGLGSHTPQKHVSALVTSGSLLYAAGEFKSYLNDDHRETNSIAQWDGSKWSNLGKGLKGDAYSLVIYNGELFVGGSFKSVGGDLPANGIARWK